MSNALVAPHFQTCLLYTSGADYGDAAKQDRHQQRIVGLLREEQVPRLQNPLPRLCKHALILARRAICKYASQ